MQATCTDDLFEVYCHQVDTCIQISLECVKTDSQKRPNIIEITKKLDALEFNIGKVINANL